jgi:Uma2 family endonuclease
VSRKTKPRFTPEIYLALERLADHKSEYLNGEIFAMAGASEPHNLIVTNVVSELRTQLKGRACKVYPSDMRVKVGETGLYTYPDVVALCGRAEFEDNERDTLVNPAVIIEVLSPSTEAYDRGKKFEHYRRLRSLAEYVLISQERHRIEYYQRQANDQWLLTEINGLESRLHLSAIDCDLALAEVYDKVQIEGGDALVL